VSRVNRAAARLLALAVTVLVVSSVPLAQGAASPPALDRPSPVRTAGEEASGLIDLWNLRRRQLGRGDVLAADQAEEELRSLRRRNGVRRAQEVAGAFVLEGYEELALQHFTEARESFHLALEFDPDMPRAHLGLAATEWTSGGGMLITGRSYLDAGRAAARNWLYQAIGVQVATWIGLLGLPVAFAAIYLLLFLKTFPLIHHGLAEMFARRLPSTTARTLAALVPLLPLALPWGVAWTPLLWLALASPHFSRRERVVASAGLLLIAACGILLLPAARFTALSTDPRLIHVAGAARGAIGPERERTLAELLEKSPDDAVLQFLYADQARGLGDYVTAIRAYQRAAELDPTLRPAHNNLGTLYFSLGQYATAVREFRRAMEADPQEGDPLHGPVHGHGADDRAALGEGTPAGTAGCPGGHRAGDHRAAACLRSGRYREPAGSPLPVAPRRLALHPLSRVHPRAHALHRPGRQSPDAMPVLWADRLPSLRSQPGFREDLCFLHLTRHA